MLSLNNESLIIMLSYLVPGYIINTILSKRLKMDRSSNNQVIEKMVLFSFINILVASILESIAHNLIPITIQMTNLHKLALQNILLPIILGMLLLYLLADEKPKSFKSFFQMIGVDKISRTNTAWEYAFDNLSQGAYVIVTLKSKEKIYGLYASSSFVGINEDKSDSIYLEDTFVDFINFESINYGILIEASNILTIEIDKEQIC